MNELRLWTGVLDVRVVVSGFVENFATIRC